MCVCVVLCVVQRKKQLEMEEKVTRKVKEVSVHAKETLIARFQTEKQKQHQSLEETWKAQQQTLHQLLVCLFFFPPLCPAMRCSAVRLDLGHNFFFFSFFLCFFM